MWEGNYAAEPFDLRLTLLRLVRSLGWILLLTVLGTVVFGGGYYLKNVVFGEKPKYEKTITCKIEYTDPPTKSGDYYINEMTWNTYVDSGEFYEMVADVLTQTDGGAGSGALSRWTQDRAAAAELVSVKVASDVQVPSFTVSTEDEIVTDELSRAVEGAVTGAFAESLPEVASIRVIDETLTTLVKPDVRPLRAFILSAVLSGFFVITAFLLREIGADSIWLPATLRRRYGLPTLGTVQSPEFHENVRYLFGDKKKVAVCTASEAIDPLAVIHALEGTRWLALPATILSPEAVQVMREADGVLLVVPAGLHTGKPLEHVLEFLKTQEISVTASLLWEADEALISTYYFLPGGRE